ncbi:MAG: hypothetical protein KGN79_08245 [Acidobacteriota bacterium]|nr:hypothetical protein [Acidobacteriota bacterium]
MSLRSVGQNRNLFAVSICLAGAMISGASALAAPSCTSQSALTPTDRNALAATGEQLGQAIIRGDISTLHAALLPAISDQWAGIQNEAQEGEALVKGGQVELRNAYLLDATSQTATADTQFFCSNASGSLTVTVNMRALPPGRYALLLASAKGAPLDGQMGFVLVWDTTSGAPAWKLGGLSVRQGSFENHDGVWYWTRARALEANGQPWSAWYSYDYARYMLVPVDFLSSPNLDKLNQEQSDIKNGPANAFPLSIPDGDRTWKILSMRIDPSLREPDLDVRYESLGIADPAAQRTEAIAVLSSILKAHPDLRANFHGLWAVASKDGKTTPVLELPMAKIP